MSEKEIEDDVKVKEEEVKEEKDVKEDVKKTTSKTQDIVETKKVKTITLDVLVEGDSQFTSKGYSNVKRTLNGEVANIRIPIKSTGVTELIEQFKRNEPKPPGVSTLVKKDSEMGKQQKFTEDKWIKLPDFTDERYLKEKEDYEAKLGVQVLTKGVDAPFKNKKGVLITDGDQKVQILEDMGLSSEQFTQITNDIRMLTMWSDTELQEHFGLSSV